VDGHCVAGRAATQRCGDALIGRHLYRLLSDTRPAGISVTPRIVHVDGRRPDLAAAFTRRTFTAMIVGVRERVLASTRMEPARFDAGIRAVERAAAPYGVVCFTFFNAVRQVPSVTWSGDGVEPYAGQRTARTPNGEPNGGCRPHHSARLVMRVSSWVAARVSRKGT
jgi:hypothetical protein